jgi:hypothetical protein
MKALVRLDTPFLPVPAGGLPLPTSMATPVLADSRRREPGSARTPDVTETETIISRDDDDDDDAQPTSTTDPPPRGADVTEAFYALAVLACPVGMGLMMWMMMRGGKQTTPVPPAQPSGSDAELVALRAEVDQLRAEQRDRRGDLGTCSGGAGSR